MEHSVVEAQLAELEASKRPEVDQGERECDLSGGQSSSKSTLANVHTCIMKGMLTTSRGYSGKLSSKSIPTPATNTSIKSDEPVSQ